MDIASMFVWFVVNPAVLLAVYFSLEKNKDNSKFDNFKN